MDDGQLPDGEFEAAPALVPLIGNLF